MIIAAAFDHGGFPMKETVLDTIRQAGHQPLDLGAYTYEMDDYPDYALKIGQAIIEGQAQLGVFVCGSGVGASIAANKIPGIYACVCHDTYSAHQGVEHDNMNVLCLGARIIGPELARELILAFLGAHFSDVERYHRRFKEVQAIESKNRTA